MYQWLVRQLEASYAWQRKYAVGGLVVAGLALVASGFVFARPGWFDLSDEAAPPPAVVIPQDGAGKTSHTPSARPSPTRGNGKQPQPTQGPQSSSPATSPPSAPAASTSGSAPPASGSPTGDPSAAGGQTDPPDGGSTGGDTNDNPGGIDLPEIPITVGDTTP